MGDVSGTGASSVAADQTTDMSRAVACAAVARGRPGLVQIFPRSTRAIATVFRVAGSAMLGRGEAVGIRVPDARVSRNHARLESRPSGIGVFDLGSRHGSRVAGRSVGSEGTLASFDSVVRFGDTLCLVVRDVERYRVTPRRISGAALGMPSDVLAGPLLADVWDRATRVAALSAPVLLLGESGTGKEILARLIHRATAHLGPFVGINVAAIPEALFESELFGHDRGAFTGAMHARTGAFREAAGGILFLDEVGELRLDLQAKLLRAVDLQSVRPLGSDRDVPVSVRLVTATSVDLAAACDAGKFRADLYYRLQGVTLRVPPLRERPDDVLLLAESILEDEGARARLSTDAAEKLSLARWEGNTRALRSAVVQGLASALSAGSSELRAEHLPALETASEGPLSEEDVRAAMVTASGIASQAALSLGVSRTTFYKLCKRFGVTASSLRSE
jgi:transcriptional regulator of acetoin/glycerol metabolism